MLPFPSSLLVAGGSAPTSLVLDFAAGQFRAGDRLFHSIDQLPGYAFERMGEQGALDAIREYLQVKSVWLNYGAEVPNPFIMRL